MSSSRIRPATRRSYARRRRRRRSVTAVQFCHFRDGQQETGMKRAGLAVAAVLVAAGAVLTGGGPAAAGGSAPSDGTPFTAAHSGKCLEVKAASQANNAAVQQSRCTGGASQRWIPVPQDDGTYQLVAQHSGKCLNVPGVSTADSVAVEQYTCVAGAANEKWTPKLVPGTRDQYTLVALHSGKCLNVKGASTADAAVVQQYRCTGTATNERWTGAPAGAALAIDPAPRSAVLQSAPGAPIQLAHVNGYGQAYYGTTSPAATVASWRALPGPESFTGAPALLPAGNGGQVLALGGTGTVWGRPALTGSWLGTGAPAASPPVTATDLDGVRYAVATDTAGHLRYVQDDGTHVPFQAWRDAGPTGSSGPMALAAAPGYQSGVAVFGITAGGELRTTRLFAGGQTSGWTSLGTGVTGVPSVATLPGPLTVVAARGSDGTIRVKHQMTGGAWPATWTTLPGFTAVGSPAILLTPTVAASRIWVYARSADGTLASTSETFPATRTYRPWSVVPGTTDAPANTDPTVFTYTTAVGGSPTWGVAFRTFDDRTVVNYIPSPPTSSNDLPAYNRVVLAAPA
jgi:hypothetical protein